MKAGTLILLPSRCSGGPLLLTIRGEGPGEETIRRSLEMNP